MVGRPQRRISAAPETGPAAPVPGNTTPATFRAKAVVVNFWASRCSPGEREMPMFEAGHRQLGNRGELRRDRRIRYPLLGRRPYPPIGGDLPERLRSQRQGGGAVRRVLRRYLSKERHTGAHDGRFRSGSVTWHGSTGGPG